jgi:hypothetical protein
VRIVFIKVGVDTLAGLPPRFSGVFATCQGLSYDRGMQEPHLSVFLCELSLELAGLSHLCSNIRVTHRWGRWWVWLRVAWHIPVAYFVCSVSVFVDGKNEALTCGIVAPHAGVVIVAQPVVRMRTMCGSRTGGWSLPCVMSD